MKAVKVWILTQEAPQRTFRTFVEVDSAAFRLGSSTEDFSSFVLISMAGLTSAGDSAQLKFLVLMAVAAAIEPAWKVKSMELQAVGLAANHQC